jgi:translation initiation factor IF-1
MEYNLARTGDIVDDIRDLDMKIRPGDTVTITGQSAANMDFDFTARWREYF